MFDKKNHVHETKHIIGKIILNIVIVDVKGKR